MTRYTRVDPADEFPPDPDFLDGLDLLLYKQHDVIGRRQALRHLTEAAIRHRLVTGRWRLSERGIYVTHSGPLTHEQS